jgi:plasmid stabilization system protein ParE
MKYTVVWTPVAERRLTQLWLNSRMRSEIRRAADHIDASLAENPYDYGESREGKQRIVLEHPIGVLVEVNDADRQVRVLAIWSY